MVAGLPHSAWTVNNTFENKVLRTLELSEAVTMPAAAICKLKLMARSLQCSSVKGTAHIRAGRTEGRRGSERVLSCEGCNRW